jgi:hypothetical protein
MGATSRGWLAYRADTVLPATTCTTGTKGTTLYGLYLGCRLSISF